MPYINVPSNNRREVTQRRRQRQREGQKSNNFALASRFFVHFFAVVARLQGETA